MPCLMAEFIGGPLDGDVLEVPPGDTFVKSDVVLTDWNFKYAPPPAKACEDRVTPGAQCRLQGKYTYQRTGAKFRLVSVE